MLVEPVAYQVYVSDTPEVFDPDLWNYLITTDEKHLIVAELQLGLAPTMTQATLAWNFGDMSRLDPAGVESEAMDYRKPLDLAGRFVWIHVETDTPLDWVGYIRDEARVNWAEEEYDPGGSPDPLPRRIFGGDQTYTAYGLEYFLAREQVTGTSSRQADRNRRPHTYNTGCGDGRDLDVAKRANKAPSSEDLSYIAPFENTVLPEFDFTTDAVEWAARFVIMHLLLEHGPRDHADALAPLKFLLHDDAHIFLNWYKPTVGELEGRTLWKILDEIIDQRRGLVWWLACEEHTVEFGGDPELVAVIHVTSIATSAVTLPDGALLPAALSIATIDDPNALELLEPVTIFRDGSRRYDRVRVRGARRTTTFSAQGPSVVTTVAAYAYPVLPPNGPESSFAPAWSSDDEDDYVVGVRPTLAAPDQAIYDAMTEDEKQIWNDRFRQNERFERVFRYYDVTLAAQMSPVIQQSTGSVTGWIPADGRVVRLQARTPLRVNTDYADATEPTVNGAITAGDEFVKPFVVGYLPTGAGFLPTTLGEMIAGEPPTSSDGGWRFMHHLSSHKERGFTLGEDSVTDWVGKNVFLAIASGGAGFILRPGGSMAHALAPALPPEFAPSSYGGRGVGWSSMLITASVEWEAYCEGVHPDVAPTAAPIEELLIRIGERARFDYVQLGTVYDLDEHGHVKQVAVAGAIRDDRKLCETVAQLAFQWYGSERAQVTLAMRKTQQPVTVGDLVTAIGTDDAQETVNAIVSQVTHRLEEGGTTIHCNFPELDFADFA